MADIDLKIENPELTLLRNNKESGYNYRQRRTEQWRENYTLSRDTVEINRLEQRQSVNVPLMKTTLRSLIKDVDDMPILFFENLDNDKDAEIFQNEYWKWTLEFNNSEVQDIIDKRQEFLAGRTFDQWQVKDGKIVWSTQDVEDFLVSRYVKTHDLNTTRFLIHTHIFTPLSELELNPDYDKAAIQRLKTFYATEQGLVKAADHAQMLVEKNQKLSEMGVPDVDSPILGETYVEQSLHFVFRDNEKDGSGALMDPQFFLYVEVDDMEILMKKPLEDVIGKTSDHWWRTHLPYHSWADDIDLVDFWTDGVADIVRTPNKILNAFFSQLVENRTLRNYGMQFYDTGIEGYNPGSFDPVPFGSYPIHVPEGKKIQDVLMRVDIPDLSESMDEMQFVIDMVQKATGATTTQQGEIQQRQVTLGEVELALGEAKERIKGLAKFYLPVWKQRGQTFLKLIEAASDKLDAVKIYKKGKNTNDVYSQEIMPDSWMTKSGYAVRVWSQEEKMTNDTNALQKLNAAKVVMPGNNKLDEIYKRKLLNFADCTPEEVNSILEEEKSRMKAIADAQMGMNNNPVATPVAPAPARRTIPAPSLQPTQTPVAQVPTPLPTLPLKSTLVSKKTKTKAKKGSKKKKNLVNKLKTLRSQVRK